MGLLFLALTVLGLADALVMVDLSFLLTLRTEVVRLEAEELIRHGRVLWVPRAIQSRLQGDRSRLFCLAVRLEVIVDIDLEMANIRRAANPPIAVISRLILSSLLFHRKKA